MEEFFEINDFLPINRYMELQKSYPQESNFGKSGMNYNKRTFTNNDKKFSEFLDQNICWKQFMIDLNQQKVSLNSYKGKKLCIFMWASW